MWKWIIIAALVLLCVVAYGYIQDLRVSKKVEQLKADESQVVQQKEDWIKACEDEISKVARERDRIRVEKEAAGRQTAQALADAERQRERNNDLQAQLDRVSVSSDPAGLLRDLQGRGIRIRALGSQ